MENNEGTEGFNISISSSREFYYGFDFSRDVSDNIFEEKEFSLWFVINIKECETDKKVAYIRGVLFDEDKMLDMGLDIVEGADYIAQEEYDSAYWLSKSVAYRNKSENWIWNSSFSGYLATFYIYEEFRNSGIATYLFTNLNKLLKYSLNINLRCLCTYPQPQKPEEWSNIDNNEMKKIMINTIVKNGFKPVGKKNYYVKEYEVL